MALDPSAKQADRLIDVAFALKNPGTKPWTVRSVSLSADGKPLGSSPLAISALPGQTTQVWAAAIQLGREQDPAKFAHLDLLFADDHGKALARSTVDAPRVGTLFAPLDESHPAGPATLDSMDVERVEGFGRRPHFEVSFAVANPGKDKLTVAKITIAPPKGRSEDAQLNLEVPPRTATGVLTVVLPYPGKTLPLGKYAASIVGPSGSVIAKASADLI
ncbi:MAG: hypothetical protein M3T49_10235 [Candidatus Eremiobacteraeota bacterium]|nr:hypothetical protein [Candidatus Eremiobacteraeota bacterium]